MNSGKMIMTKAIGIIMFLAFNQTLRSQSIEELNHFLTQKEIQYEKIAFNLGDAYWNFYSAEAEADLKTPKHEFQTVLFNDTLHAYIKEWYPRLEEIKDTILKRRVGMWHNVLLSASVEYSPEVMALRNELEEALEVSGNNIDTTYNFGQNMLKLIELRNKKAVELGFDNYVHLIFETNGMGYKWFLNFIDEMDKSTMEPYKRLIEETKQQNNSKPFEMFNAYMFVGQFYRNQNPDKLKELNNIELVKASLHNIGIDYNTLPAKLVEMQLPAGVGGQGLMINIPNDFRAVMTLGMDISVWMHEMGHGLHGLFNSINSPILEGYEWVPGNTNPGFAEGMAETSAYFTRNSKWQKEYTSLTDEEIKERKDIVNKFAPAFIRFHLLNFMQETELYLHPEKTYEQIQIELTKKYLLVETDNIRTGNLKNIIYVSYPLYLQNYLVADMVATQIHTTLENKFGDDYAFNKNIGNYLAENFYGAGEYFNWNQRLAKGTGKGLDIKSYLDYYHIK